jgi:hypothetical protein
MVSESRSATSKNNVTDHSIANPALLGRDVLGCGGGI